MISNPFVVKDCALIQIATGVKVQTLRELKKELLTIDEDSIYYHFWGSLLTPRFREPEFGNDFASWAFHALHDRTLAERLSVIDPLQYSDIQSLRLALLDVIDERLDEVEVVPFSSSDQQFNFVKCQIVVFNTQKLIDKPEELGEAIMSFSSGSIFYHFIDARRRTKGNIDDFRAWLKMFGDRYKKLSTLISQIDPYFTTLLELRELLAQTFNDYFKVRNRE